MERHDGEGPNIRTQRRGGGESRPPTLMTWERPMK